MALGPRGIAAMIHRLARVPAAAILMHVDFLLAMLLGLATLNGARADQYPISGAWAAMDEQGQNDAAASCKSLSKSPKSPIGHIIIFNGTTRVDLNGGYFEKETVKIITLQKDGPDEFTVTDSYYFDGEEGGGSSGQKRRSYRLKLLGPDTIEIKLAKYPASRFLKCSSAAETASNPPKQNSNADDPTTAQYNVQLVQHIQKFQQYPAKARERHAEGLTLVNFTIDREGHILSSGIQKSSGSADLDQEGLAMLTRAQPLPAFPSTITEKTRTYTLQSYGDRSKQRD